VPRTTARDSGRRSIPAVVHLHGGEVPPQLDGGPDAWYTSDGLYQGAGYYSFAGANPNEAIYKYPNTQEAGPLWFHDHTLGATRLNVYAGLAGAYYLEDPALWSTNRTTTRGTQGTCTAGCLPDNLQSIGQVIPLVIQDRMFDTNASSSSRRAARAMSSGRPTPNIPTGRRNSSATPSWSTQGLALHQRGAQALPFPVPQRLQRPHLRDVPHRPAQSRDAAEPVGHWHRRRLPGCTRRPEELTMMPGERYEVIIDFAAVPAAQTWF